MVSRDTRVQIVVGLLAFAVLIGASQFGYTDDGPATLAVLVVAYGLFFGGAHLYLAIRGDGGVIPVESRWRYVGALAIVMASAVLIAAVGDLSLGPATVETVGLGVIVLTASGYLITESTSGYRASRTE